INGSRVGLVVRGALTLKGLGGDDTFQVRSIPAGVGPTLDGGGGSDRLVFDDTASVGRQRTSLYADRLDHVEVIPRADGYDYVNAAAFFFGGMEAIDLRTAGGYYNDTYVLGSAATTPVRVYGNPNALDAFVAFVQSNEIQGPVSFFGQTA